MKNKMNKFIKGIALGAAASLMALSFAACSDSGAASLNLVSEGKLTMGTNAQFPPFEYYEGSEIVGVDAAIMEAIAEKLGLELEIKDMEFESLSAALSGGNIDVIAAGFTISPPSRPFWSARTAITRPRRIWRIRLSAARPAPRG